MKIIFDEKGCNYIEISKFGNNIHITISAQDKDNLRKTVVNSAELTMEKFSELISNIEINSNNKKESK